MDAERLAKFFHETYERLAPTFGYETQARTAVAWENVPEDNKRLMIHVCRLVLNKLGLMETIKCIPNKHGEYIPIKENEMLYTLGKTEAYESYIKSCLQINIKPEKRKGGTVWLSIKDVISYLKEIYPNNDETKEYTIYEVIANWEKDTKLPEWSGLESERKNVKYRELTRDAEIKKIAKYLYIEIEIETDKEEKNKKEELELTFKECNICSKKSGSPLLCESCLNNRKVISDLKKTIERLEKETEEVDKILERIKTELKNGLERK
jgi:hypothetical protein